MWGAGECALLVNPFRQDWCEFEEFDRLKGISMLTHSQAMLAACPVRQDSCQESLMLSTQRIFQVAAFNNLFYLDFVVDVLF